MVAPGVGSIWETWQIKLTSNGWQPSNGGKFDLKANALRPTGWASGDASGLPMFPARVRYDECQGGMVKHAPRGCAKTRREYIYPANHYASSIPGSSVNYPAMGQRLRLKASFVIPTSWTKEEKAVLLALKKKRMGGKAQQGVDYTLDGSSGKVTIPAGQTSARVVLHAIIDNEAELREGAGMRLTNGPGHIRATPSLARVMILKSP